MMVQKKRLPGGKPMIVFYLKLHQSIIFLRVNRWQCDDVYDEKMYAL